MIPEPSTQGFDRRRAYGLAFRLAVAAAAVALVELAPVPPIARAGALPSTTPASLSTAPASPSTAPASPSVPASPSAPTGSPPGTAPVGGRMRLTLHGVGGSPPFALLGRRIVVRGSVTPYVPGQSVEVVFYLAGRVLGSRSVAVFAGRGATGRFEVSFTSHHGGLSRVRASHAASGQQAGFSAVSSAVRFVDPNVSPGSRGQSVRLLQDELAALHYAVSLSGVFDEGTGEALIAYRKQTFLPRTAAAGTRVFERLARGAGSFHVRYPGDGRHVEADLTTQVLAEIEAHGRVRRIYTMSSGKPSTPTVIGRFQVYEKTPGENSEGMVDSNYFIRGYAIHGYAEVPTYAASHGCLRVPIPDASSIYGWVQVGTPVDVYEQDGGGSTRVRDNAGP